MDSQLSAIVEVLKDFVRWALSFFIGWLLDNGYSFFAGTKLDPNAIFVISIFFKYADYAWHRYRKEQQQVSTGESLGIYPI